MCGICGFTGAIQNKENVLSKMMQRIIHRGPDSNGVFIDDNVALGFQRLSIIEVEYGSQPMINNNGDIIITFNGEIYNFLELKKELIEKGHTFKMNSDTEVLLHCYEEYGESMLNKLRGMFAFVVYDIKKELLFGARDNFGIKPFYYSVVNGNFVYGSEIKSILEYPEYKKELNTEALEQYLSFQYSVLTETFFKGIFKLMPGHCFTFKHGKLDVKKYFELKFDINEEKSLDEWVDEIDETMDKSIEAHKISDVEVGSFLSSGIDSSYVASSANVDKTFTVGFDYGTKYDERSYASDFSKEISVKNISKTITPEEYWENFSKIQYHMDEPLADPSAVALFFLSETASKSVKVCLSGEGADEFFGGYNTYFDGVALQWYNNIPLFLRSGIAKIASAFNGKHGFNFLIRRGKNLEDYYIGNANMFSVIERKKLLKIKTSASSPSSIVKPFFDKTKGMDPVTKMQFVDMNTWLIGDILLKADKMSMANSLEVRVPFLDKEVAKLALQIPAKHRISQTQTKIPLRQSALRHIPPAWANKKKLGFPIPTREWLKEDKYYNIVKDSFSSKICEQFFDTNILINLLDEHKDLKRDNSRKIWTVYTFLVWYKRFFVDM